MIRLTHTGGVKKHISSQFASNFVHNRKITSFGEFANGGCFLTSGCHATEFSEQGEDVEAATSTMTAPVQGISVFNLNAFEV